MVPSSAVARSRRLQIEASGCGLVVECKYPRIQFQASIPTTKLPKRLGLSDYYPDCCGVIVVSLDRGFRSCAVFLGFVSGRLGGGDRMEGKRGCGGSTECGRLRILPADEEIWIVEDLTCK